MGAGSKAEAGDCVLIAGKGHEDYQTIGGKRYWFDDREIARQWLYDHAAAARNVAPVGTSKRWLRF